MPPQKIDLSAGDAPPVDLSAGDSPPAETPPAKNPGGDLMRGYSAVGEDLKALFQNPANLLEELNVALGKKGGIKELIQKHAVKQPKGIAQTTADVYKGLSPASIHRNPDGSIDWPATIGGTIGRTAGILGIPEAREGVEAGAEVAGKAAKGATELPRTTMRGFTHTGERQTRQLVDKTIAENAAAKKAAEATNLKNLDRASELNATRQERYQEKAAAHEVKSRE